MYVAFTDRSECNLKIVSDHSGRRKEKEYPPVFRWRLSNIIIQIMSLASSGTKLSVIANEANGSMHENQQTYLSRRGWLQLQNGVRA